ncbi:hypothetical protein [Emticicia sp. C21]|uniref:hypothetical protein n=1 Tax=Emticicia sp. C21 TaxID=2302915 RepID=UPI0011C1A5BB|nr:hypothetical protein [Emticicia sp. C21]
MFKDFESEPKEESWDKILASMPLSQMFQDFEAEPQDESWEKIRAGIDLSQKMKEYEPEPQEDSWDKIRAGVDLAQKFKDYEPEPQAISWLKIQEAIQPKKRRRGIIIPLFYRVGIAAGLVLLLGSLWWLLNSKENAGMTAVNSDNKKPTTASQPISTKAGDTANMQKRQTQETQSAEKPGEKQIPLLQSTSNENVVANTTNSKTDKSNLSNKNISIGDKKATKGQRRVVNNNQGSFIANNKPNRKNNQDSGVKPPVSNKEEITSEANNENEILANNNSENNTAEELKLEQLSGKEFKPKAIRKPFSAIAYNAERPYQVEEPEQRVHRKINFTASLMPLQTYQAFTILPQTNTYIQQVGRLDAIDNQRLGIQVRTGAMKPLSERFAMGISGTYTGLQQWANYEINSGDYEVQTADNGSYTLVGIGEQVAQKQFMQTLGLKLDNAYLISRKKTSVYAIGGAEAVHVLNNKDFGYYVNASVGVSYPIKGGKSLWIEPTFRYSLSQSFDANNYLKIRPYNIGLNLRINFI